MNDAHKPPLEVYSAESEGALVEGATGVLASVDGRKITDAVLKSEAAPDAETNHTPAPSASACPTCGRKPPAPKKQSKLRGSKTIKVPKDAQEDGVELLETLIAQVEGDLRPNERPRSPYYTLIEALYFFLTNAKKEAA